jgi:hypothetical protein
MPVSSPLTLGPQIAHISLSYLPPPYFCPAVLLPSPSTRRYSSLPGPFSSFYFPLSDASLAVAFIPRLHPSHCGHLLDLPGHSSHCHPIALRSRSFTLSPSFHLQPSPAPDPAALLFLPLGIFFSLLALGPLAIPPTA